MMEVLVKTGAIKLAKLQSYHHHRHIIAQLLTGRMPFPWQNLVKAQNEKVSYSTDLLTSNSPVVLRPHF